MAVSVALLPANVAMEASGTRAGHLLGSQRALELLPPQQLSFNCLEGLLLPMRSEGLGTFAVSAAEACKSSQHEWAIRQCRVTMKVTIQVEDEEAGDGNCAKTQCGDIGEGDVVDTGI